ncbi:MAG: response regulator [Planctomycetaceae bacterium]
MSQLLSRTARIAVVDDHAIVRYGYTQLINLQPNLIVCGVAADEEEGLELVKRESPDLTIVDLSLNQGHGLDLIKSILAHHPKSKILVVSAHNENLFAQRVLAAGALGYVNKQRATSDLIEAIQAILNGERYFSAPVAQTLTSGDVGNRPAGAGEVQLLTDRELQVYEQIGCGKTTRDIADSLLLSIKTVERYKENIKKKLAIDNATQLVQRATHWVMNRS